MNAILNVTQKQSVPNGFADDSVMLDLDQRRKFRLKTQSRLGDEVRIFLDRDKPMQLGDTLVADCGKTLKVVGKPEPLVVARANDAVTFARVCYHLGNRHLTVQINALELRFKPDHVIEELVESFGLALEHTDTVFEPEPGAYAQGSSHSHSSHRTHNSHSGDHSHDHPHHD
ncbi:Urease accessory protein UreE [BD1-7 clade bacterium]|uniref:Urease accessory protein UreE n=1 Tax=BD1-7 clade bacterium TaxID=2029982 RepID=A0A5S9QS71_9GAMM|nr:Urease accessory protein UreE [BD1-7 clade bacterium]